MWPWNVLVGAQQGDLPVDDPSQSNYGPLRLGSWLGLSPGGARGACRS